MNPADAALAKDDDTAFSIDVSDLAFARYEPVGFAGLTEAEQTVHCVDGLEREVNNGGFDQFFFNSSGNTALETIPALERLGAKHVFPGGRPSANRDEREKQMAALERAYVQARRGEFK
jgi:hypothetical protein